MLPQSAQPDDQNNYRREQCQDFYNTHFAGLPLRGFNRGRRKR
jgi:hypothetical protein